jgi:hypothetical protein
LISLSIEYTERRGGGGGVDLKRFNGLDLHYNPV